MGKDKKALTTYHGVLQDKLSRLLKTIEKLWKDKSQNKEHLKRLVKEAKDLKRVIKNITADSDQQLVFLVAIETPSKKHEKIRKEVDGIALGILEEHLNERVKLSFPDIDLEVTVKKHIEE